MTRSLYFIGGLFAMALILLAHKLAPVPELRAGTAAAGRPSEALTTTVHEPATAIDDLAAWPAAASR